MTELSKLCKRGKQAIAQDYSSGEPMCQECIKEFIEKRQGLKHGSGTASEKIQEGC